MDVRKEGNIFAGPSTGFKFEHDRAVKDLASATIRLALTEAGATGQSLSLFYVEGIKAIVFSGGSREVFVGEEEFRSAAAEIIGLERASEMMELARAGQTVELLSQEKMAWYRRETVRR